MLLTIQQAKPAALMSAVLKKIDRRETLGLGRENNNSPVWRNRLYDRSLMVVPDFAAPDNAGIMSQ
jgi:hypothetical protein